MSWLQIKLTAADDDAAYVSNILSKAGAVAVTLQDAADQPQYEPAPGEAPLWKATQIIGLFAADADMVDVLDQLRAACNPAVVDSSHIEPLEDQDWERLWMDQFKPTRFGNRLWICPSWCEPPDPEAVNVLLDPGLAFGTGTHPTTALCLEWLDQADMCDTLVIDYGCGSGILSLAAAKLGAAHVYAVDHDPQALQATHDNACRNQIDERITTLLPDQLPAVSRDILIANILAGPLKTLAREFSSLVKPHGRLILSGILAEQAADVSDAYRPWFENPRITERDGWVRIDSIRIAEEEISDDLPDEAASALPVYRRPGSIDLNTIAAESIKAATSFPQHSPVPDKPRHTAIWSAAILLALAVFTTQYGYFYRNDLASHSVLRPWLENMCAVIRCKIPFRSNPAQIRVLAREVASHPAVSGALLINTTLVNDADYPQRYPLLELSLTDFNGDTLALRRFRPEEYLDASVDSGQGMPPHVPVQALLEIADPGKDVVGFRFGFF